MSLVQSLVLSTLERSVKALHLEEIGSAAEPYRTLRSPMSPQPVGAARLFKGPQGERAVYIGLSVPMIHLDSHMLFCFADTASALPHFTVDAVHAGSHYAFHLDLIPRVDLAIHAGYIKEVYGPLTEAFQTTRKHPGLSEAQLSPQQLALMSPWMLAHRADEAAMDAVAPVVAQYQEHWLQLCAKGLSQQVSSPDELKARDAAYRQLLFSPEIDPVWKQVERLLGTEASEELRHLLIQKEGV